MSFVGSRKLGVTATAAAVALFAIALVQVSPPAGAHTARSFKVRQIGGLHWHRAQALVTGRIRVRSLRRGHPQPVPANGRYAIGCKWVVHTRSHRDITAGRAYQQYDAIVGVRLGGSNTGKFGVRWRTDLYGRPLPAHHIHLRHCHRAREYEDL